MPPEAAKKSSAKKRSAKKLTPPQELSPAKRAAAIEGVAPAKAKKIAAREPVALKLKPGKTKNPLAPDRITAILDALRKTYPNVVCALNHRNAFELTDSGANVRRACRRPSAFSGEPIVGRLLEGAQ